MINKQQDISFGSQITENPLFKRINKYKIITDEKADKNRT